jgi:hypothetical protein
VRAAAAGLAPAGLLLAAGVALACGLAAEPVATSGWLAPLGLAGGAAVVLFVAGVALPAPGALPWALGLLAVEYLASLELRRVALDDAAPAFAAGLFLCAELGWLGLEARRGGRPWPGRAAAIGGVALAGAALGALLLLVTAVPLGGGAPMTALGVAATIAVAACLAWLSRR